MSSPVCSNCSEPLPGQADYCPACGQSIKVISRPWREVFGELLNEMFDFDGRMLLSLRYLLTRPGFLSYEYINGRRLSYTSPVRMYLIISLVFFFVLPLILPESDVSGHAEEVSVDQYSRAMFALLPIFALLLKLYYRRAFYLAHIVFTIHLFSAMFIVFATILSIENQADQYIAVLLIQLVLLLYILAYLLIALRVTYRESWLKTSLKCLGLLVLFLPIIAGVIQLASRIKPWF